MEKRLVGIEKHLARCDERERKIIRIRKSDDESELEEIIQKRLIASGKVVRIRSYDDELKQEEIL